MLDVYITVDTEIWCDGWSDLDKKFPDAFDRYIYGKTKKGNYALPMTLEILRDNGLNAVFFIEPLFSTRFGRPALEEIVGLVQENKQEIQLHLHTEWLDEAITPLFPDVKKKTQFLYDFEFDKQRRVLEHGLELLSKVGVTNVNAFRAGSYAANADTLRALYQVGISIDTSYNPAAQNLSQSIFTGELVQQRRVLNNTCVYPVSVINGGRGLRHLQVTACSLAEFKYALDQAETEGWDSVVIVTHNFELLNKAKNAPDPIVCRRFKRLCEHLSKNTHRFKTRGFIDADLNSFDGRCEPLTSKISLTGMRYVEQGLRKLMVH